MLKGFYVKRLIIGVFVIFIYLIPVYLFSETISITKPKEKKNIIKKIERTGNNSITYEHENGLFIRDI